MKCLKLVALVSAVFSSLAMHANAVAASSNTLIYISPTHYEHSVRLLHPFYNYWFKQGPIVEPIVLNALQTGDSNMAICSVGEKASKVVRITPKMFYNPQLRVYHSEMQATVFAGDGTKLGRYVGTAQQPGFVSVDHGLQRHMKQAYQLAMNDLMEKIDLSTDGAVVSEVKLPCNIVGAQIEPKINFY